jgi:hypothetical protein
MSTFTVMSIIVVILVVVPIVYWILRGLDRSIRRRGRGA